jgi:hypothetical protein
MSSVVSNLTKQLLEHALIEIKKDENIKKIKIELVDPIIDYSMGRIYPYMLITAALFILTFLIAIIILIVLLRK